MAIAGNFRALAIATRLMDTLARFYQAPTRFNQGHGSLVGVDLTNTTLADLLTLLFYADPHAAVRTPQRV
jgi:hypothetical protein